MEWQWVEWAALVTAVRATPFAFSPWAVSQVRQLITVPELLRGFTDPE